MDMNSQVRFQAAMALLCGKRQIYGNYIARDVSEAEDIIDFILSDLKLERKSVHLQGVFDCLVHGISYGYYRIKRLDLREESIYFDAVCEMMQRMFAARPMLVAEMVGQLGWFCFSRPQPSFVANPKESFIRAFSRLDTGLLDTIMGKHAESSLAVWSNIVRGMAMKIDSHPKWDWDLSSSFGAKLLPSLHSWAPQTETLFAWAALANPGQTLMMLLECHFADAKFLANVYYRSCRCVGVPKSSKHRTQALVVPFELGVEVTEFVDIFLSYPSHQWTTTKRNKAKDDVNLILNHRNCIKKEIANAGAGLNVAGIVTSFMFAPLLII